MKLITKFKKKFKAVKGKNPAKKEASSPLYGGNTPDWLITDPNEQREALNKQKSFRGGGNRPPELWFREDESKLLRFRYSDAPAIIWAYSAKLRNGRFDRYTAPGKGKPDLFRDELGLKPSFKAIYEVIDINGYKDKKGKRLTNLPRFWVVSHKVHEQLQHIAQKMGGLDRMNIEVTRTGAGNQTTYTFLPESKSPMTDEMKKAEKLTPKIATFYKPMTESEQRAVLPSIIPPNERED
jgi:hypothetical protein